MKRRWFVIALCVCVCAVMCAVCLMSSCTIIDDVANTLGIDLGGGSGSGSDDNSSGSGSGNGSGSNSGSRASILPDETFTDKELTDDDITLFANAVQDLLSYDGSYTVSSRQTESALGYDMSQWWNSTCAYDSAAGDFCETVLRYDNTSGSDELQSTQETYLITGSDEWEGYFLYRNGYYAVSASANDNGAYVFQSEGYSATWDSDKLTLKAYTGFHEADSDITSADDIVGYIMEMSGISSTIGDITLDRNDDGQTLSVKSGENGSTMFAVSGVHVQVETYYEPDENYAEYTETDTVQFTVNVIITEGKISGLYYEAVLSMSDSQYGNVENEYGSEIIETAISYEFDSTLWPSDWSAWAVE